MDSYFFHQMLFITLLGMQYHPRNSITDDREVIERILRVSQLAVEIFNEED